MEKNREKLLNEIIELELKMFLTTKSRGGVSSCQERPEAFRLMRRMAMLGHGDEFLASYLADLKKGEQDGRNFMIEKYARMEGLIPPLSNSPLLDTIADAETEFLDAAAKERPDMIRHGGLDAFRLYLRSELETLSQESLELYAQEIAQAKSENRNPVSERHEWLAEYLTKSANDVE